MKLNLRPRTYRMVGSRQVFIISLIIIALTIVLVYLQGLFVHRSFFDNSILTTTILSVSFFLFITIGLYRGVKLKDEVGIMAEHFKPKKAPWELARPAIENVPGHVFADDGLEGLLLGILFWLLFGVALVILLWLAANVLIPVVLIFVGMLYWIFFRALRLVFKNSAKCKGDLIGCIKIGVTYTLLYNFWIYGIFFLVQYLKIFYR